MGLTLQHLGLSLWVSHLPRALLSAEDEIHLSPLATAVASSAPLPQQLPPSRPPSSVSTFRPSIAIIVGILTTMFSITFLLLLYAKHCRRTAGPGRPYGDRSGGGTNASGRRNSGVDRAVVESLPVFRFGSLRGCKDGLECAVCLCRFESEELLRLLPKCKHAFHVECVDTWLDAHSTCPLCRHRVDPEDVLLAFQEYEPVAGPKPHDSSDAEGPSSGAGGRPSKSEEAAVSGTHSPTARFGFFRAGRLSGRHSSAGEKCSNSALQVVVQLPDLVGRTRRNSWDNKLQLRGILPAAMSAVGCFDVGVIARKDALLLPENAVNGTLQQRLGHQIVVSGEVDDPEGPTVPRRWSDIRPQDLLILRREMILADGGRCSGARASSCSTSGGGLVRELINSRSVSDITDVSRFGGRWAEEDRALRRWRALASKHAVRWLGRGSETDGPDC